MFSFFDLSGVIWRTMLGFSCVFVTPKNQIQNPVLPGRQVPYSPAQSYLYIGVEHSREATFVACNSCDGSK